MDKCKFDAVIMAVRAVSRGPEGDAHGRESTPRRSGDSDKYGCKVCSHG
jgi:hypothetical protein